MRLWTRRTRKVAARILGWLFTRDICGMKTGVLSLNPHVPVTSNTPPTFIIQDEDDPVDNINNSLVYYIALKKAGVPVEMHLYAHGGHAFGLRPTKFPVTGWPHLAETWLKTIGMLSE